MNPKTSYSVARRAVLAPLVGVFLGALGLPAQAQDAYPDKPVRIVVGFAPGGTNDIVARTIASKLQERFKQSFVVENRPGAASAVGNDLVAKSRPDGYTLLVSSSGGLTVNPVLMPNLAYQPEKDFDPIALVGTFPLVVTVNASHPASTLAGLIEAGKKAKEGKLDHGVASTSFQLVAETLAGATGMAFNHVSYRGSGPVVNGLLTGEIQVGLLDSAAVVAQVKGGKLKALAVTTAARSSALPDVPTVNEAGFRGYEAPIWTAFMAPRGTPEPVLQKLRGAMREMLVEKDMVERLRALGMDPGNTDHVALSRRISDDIKRWAAIAKTTNIKAD